MGRFLHIGESAEAFHRSERDLSLPGGHSIIEMRDGLKRKMRSARSVGGKAAGNRHDAHDCVVAAIESKQFPQAARIAAWRPLATVGATAAKYVGSVNEKLWYASRLRTPPILFPTDWPI